MHKRTFLKALGIGGLYISFPRLLSGTPVSKNENLPPLLVDAKGKPIRSLSKWKNQRIPVKMEKAKKDHPEKMVGLFRSAQTQPFRSPTKGIIGGNNRGDHTPVCGI